MIKDYLKVNFEMNQEMCNICKKKSKDYYELKVQFRCKFFSDLTNIKYEILSIVKNNFDDINKIINVKNCFDVYFGNKNNLNKILQLFNKKYFVLVKKSKKIVGNDFLTMKSIWRYSLLVEFINLKVGDKILLKGIKYYIKSINVGENILVLKKISDGSKKIVSYNIIKDYFFLLND